MTRLDKFCFFTPIKVLGISLVISLIIGIICEFVYPSKPTQYGEATWGGMWLGAIFFLYSALCSIASYSICLNMYRTIRNNFFLSLLSFFLPLIILPLIALVAWNVQEVIRTLGYILFTTPFIITQIYFFIKFRKQVKSGEIIKDFYIESYGKY